MSAEELCETIRTGKNGLREKIEQLRNLQSIDPKQYRKKKRILPYVVCGNFKPAIRKTEHFTNISWFILDIDHLRDKNLDPTLTKSSLSEDPSVFMSFFSPGGDGIKVVFRLAQNCYDHEAFGIFYRLFCRDFSTRHGLEQVIDKRTSDVTRACFLSYDPNIYFNPGANPVDMAGIIDFESASQLNEAEAVLKSMDNESRTEGEEEDTSEEVMPDRETLDAIRARLNPRSRPSRKKEYYVPEELKDIDTEVRAKAAECGMEVSSVRDIQYGKQIGFTAGKLFGELNIFYGKKGYTVVRSTKSSCEPELTKLAYEMVMGILV